MTKDEFIKKANEIHHEKYDYSLVPDNVKYNDKIQVICSKKYPWGEPHGIFIIQVGHHIGRGSGCQKCAGKYKRTKEDFVKEATYIHNGLYTYDNFVWVNSHTKGIIHCTKHNIDFEMSPGHHLSGQGCPKCRYEKASKSKTKDFGMIIQRANEMHNHYYSYEGSTYINTHEKMRIICPIHGEFWQTIDNHTNIHHPQGCPICGKIQGDKSRIMSFGEFVKKANVIHNSKYTYDENSYAKCSESVRIYCPIHGWFYQNGTNHLSGQGCPKCSNQMSKGEEEILDFITRHLKIKNVEQRNRTEITPYELDIFIPSKRTAIEYNGLVWHSLKFDKRRNHLLEKTNMCNENSIRLIHIYEDEWMFSKEQVKNRLSSILGKNKIKIYARKCEIKNVDSKTCNSFLETNHIQGKCNAKFRYGLYFNNELVSVMTFGMLRKNLGSKSMDGEYEMIRFCNKTGVNVVGGASKLLKYFIDEVKPKSIISYADKRWSDGNLYYKLGFMHTHDSKPNYFYVVGKHRENRFKYRKSELVRQGFDSNKSEQEIMEERKIPRIYDCGCMCFRMNV